MDLGFLKWALRSMFCVIGYSWSSSVVVDEGSIGPSGKLLCLSQPLPPKKMMQHMHGIIAYMLDCWADPVVHLLLLKSTTKNSINEWKF